MNTTKALVKLLHREADQVLLEVIAPQDLLYFKGHFPVAPVLPGVVQVDWVIQLARDYFELPPYFGGMQGLKFQQIIRPDVPVSLELRYQAPKEAVQFRYFSEVGQHASGLILFKAVAPHHWF